MWIGWGVEKFEGCRTFDDRRFCGDVSKGFMCLRESHHLGRHLAAGATDIVAAWPGDHAPTPADLAYYRRAHFVETGCECCPDGREIKAEMAAEKAAREQVTS